MIRNGPWRLSARHRPFRMGAAPLRRYLSFGIKGQG
jgi:hypothetical protein